MPGRETRARAMAQIDQDRYPSLMEFQYASDQTLQVSLGDAIALETHQRVRKLLRLLQVEAMPGVRNLHPAYCSLLIKFDPLRTDHATVERTVRERAAAMDQIMLPEPRVVEIPVSYGGESGPDLEGVARLCGMEVDEVIRIHSQARYLVTSWDSCRDSRT